MQAIEEKLDALLNEQSGRVVAAKPPTQSLAQNVNAQVDAKGEALVQALERLHIQTQTKNIASWGSTFAEDLEHLADPMTAQSAHTETLASVPTYSLADDVYDEVPDLRAQFSKKGSASLKQKKVYTYPAAQKTTDSTIGNRFSGLVVQDAGADKTTQLVRTTQLLDVESLKKAVMDAIEEAKKGFMDAIAEAVKKVAISVSAAIIKAMDIVKNQLKALADKAVALATEGLGALKDKLAAFPKTVQDALDKLCSGLPTDPDLQTPCKEGLPNLIKKVASTLAELCKAGVTKLIGTANTTLTAAADKVSDIVLKGGAKCAELAAALPPQLASPIAEACNNVSKALAPMPKEVIDMAMEAGSKLAGGICDAIGAASGETTAIAEGNTLQSLALAKQNKCPVFISQQLAETTGASLGSEIATEIGKAKDELLKVAKEAMSKGIATVAKTLTTVLMEGLEALTTELKTKADELSTKATDGLGKLTGMIVTIPPKVKELTTTMCGLLPDASLKELCTTKTGEIITAATQLIGKMCTAGVTSLTGLATKGCAEASKITDGLLAKAGDECTKLIGGLPVDIAEAKDALTGCCKNVTGKLTGIVGELCDVVVTKLNASLHDSCVKIGNSANRRRLLGEGVYTVAVDGATAARHLLAHLTSLFTDPRTTNGIADIQFEELSAQMQELADEIDPAAAAAALKDALVQVLEDGKAAFLEAFTKAAAIAAEALRKALATIIAALKAELTAKAEEASKAATDGVEKLKGILEKIPDQVLSVINSLCGALPGDELQKTCKDGAKEIVATAAKVLGSLCSHGLGALIKLGKEACVKANELAAGVLSKASGFCTIATDPLPADIAKPLSSACVNVTGELIKLPGEICDWVLDKAEKLGNTTCEAVTQIGVTLGAAKKALTQTAMKSRRIRNRFEHLYMTKLGAFEDFIPKLKKAIEDAKNDLIKIKDEAIAKAARIVATSVANVLIKAIEPVKQALKDAASAAVAVAKTGLTALTAGIAQIPTKIQEALTSACGGLPGGDELKGLCSTGLAGIVKKAVEVLGKVCHAGCKVLIDKATEACKMASDKTSELLTKANDACTSAAGSLPETIKDPILEACKNVTEALDGVVMEICNHTKNEVEGAVSAACDALTPKAATYARIRGDTQTLMLLHEYDRQQELIRLQVQQHERYTMLHGSDTQKLRNFRSWDTDNSGGISRGEWMRKGRDPASFARADTNHDGRIDLKEMSANLPTWHDARQSHIIDHSPKPVDPNDVQALGAGFSMIQDSLH